MSYFGGGNSGFNNLGLTGLGGNYNLENNANRFTGLGYDGLQSGFNLANNAYGFNGLGYSGLNSGFNPGNNIFANNFSFGGPSRQTCPAGCYRAMPGEPCFQGYCPDGCCQLT